MSDDVHGSDETWLPLVRRLTRKLPRARVSLKHSLLQRMPGMDGRSSTNPEIDVMTQITY